MSDPTRVRLIRQFCNAHEDAKGLPPSRAKLRSLVSWIDEDVEEETRELEREKAMAETLGFPERDPAERLMDAQDILAERGWMFEGDDSAVELIPPPEARIRD
jgi:hypothetical protein